MKKILKAVWLFCSYLFWPQWGRKRCNIRSLLEDTDKSVIELLV